MEDNKVHILLGIIIILGIFIWALLKERDLPDYGPDYTPSINEPQQEYPGT